MRYRIRRSVGALMACATLAACATSTPRSEPLKGAETPQVARQRATPQPHDDAGVARAVGVDGVAERSAEEQAASGAPAPEAVALQTSAPGQRQGETAPERTPDVIYVPTPQPVVDRMLKMARVTKDDVVYDLGCGDGRIVVTAAKKYGARAFGFDIDPKRVAEARENVRKHGVEDLVTIQQRDIFTLDLRPASVVTLYLLPRLNVKLIPQLEKLKQGTRIVSHDFAMEGIVPEERVEVNTDNSGEHVVYLWRTPLKREQTR